MYVLLAKKFFMERLWHRIIKRILEIKMSNVAPKKTPWRFTRKCRLRHRRRAGHSSAHTWNIGHVQKKARLVWLRKLQDVRQIARLKQQRSLSFTFCKTQRSYEKIKCIYLLFHWFSCKNCIIRSSDRRCSI